MQPDPHHHATRSAAIMRYGALLYSLFFLLDPIQRHSTWHWWLLAAAYPLFLLFYIGTFTTRGRMRFVFFILLYALGFAYTPFNQSACGIFVYPISMLAFMLRDTRKFFYILTAQVTAIAFEGYILHLPWFSTGLGIGLSLIVGLSNLYYAQQQQSDAKLRMAHDEIEQLAKVAERERIARDLHDLLGHTLTLVVLKTELAQRLVTTDPVAATNELAEIQTTARKALAEVRDAVLGYRSTGLPEEIDRARHTLATSGITLIAEPAPANIPATEETVLALAVREAVTNIMRHSEATTCTMRFTTANNQFNLTVEDNGKGGASEDGFGLRGMRERIEALGGHFTIDSTAGTRLIIALPNPPAAAQPA